MVVGGILTQLLIKIPALNCSGSDPSINKTLHQTPNSSANSPSQHEYYGTWYNVSNYLHLCKRVLKLVDKIITSPKDQIPRTHLSLFICTLQK